MRSSNKRVADPKASYQSHTGLLELRAKQAGSTILSYRLGRKRYRTRLEFHWYRQPFTRITAGKKSIRRYNVKKYGLTISTVPRPRLRLKGKLQIVCKPGWRAERIYVDDKK